MHVRIQTWGEWEFFLFTLLLLLLVLLALGLRMLDRSLARRKALIEHADETVAEDTPTTAIDALRKGLQDMVEACDVVSDKFGAARDEFDTRKTDG